MITSELDPILLKKIKEHYEIETELADRLRNASKEERRFMYGVVYDEWCRLVPDNLLLTGKIDEKKRSKAIHAEIGILNRFVSAETIFLELGPGDCKLSCKLAKNVNKVYAIDVSHELTRLSSYPDNLELIILTDCLCIPVPENSIDVAYSKDLIEHIHPDDIHEQLRNIHKALAPGGIYICITPNRLCGPHDISGYFDSVAKGFHLKEYTISELAHLFEDYYFSKVRVFISYKGHILSPILPVFPFIWIENVISWLPYPLRGKIARMLLAVKVIATK